MSKSKGNYKNRKGSNNEFKKEAIPDNVDENSPTLQMFRNYSSQLDEKHDRYERIVKLSRDITIESKRIIFLLHNRDGDIEGKREKIFKEAETRLNQLVEKNFNAIALELEGLDSYPYIRAYTAGMQEFIEALLFCQYLNLETIQQWEVVNESFNYKIKKEEEGEEKIVTLLFPQTEYLLGLADFTGELMRKCINSLGSGNIDDCFKICGFVKFILSGFLGISYTGNKEIGRKLYTLRQSLTKMELVCYNIRVRGSEVPKHMLGIMASGPNVDIDDDEGYY